MICTELTIEALSSATGPDTSKGISRIRFYSDILIIDMPKEFTTLEMRDLIRRKAEEWRRQTGARLERVHDSPHDINKLLLRMPKLVIPTNEEMTVYGLNITYHKA